MGLSRMASARRRFRQRTGVVMPRNETPRTVRSGRVGPCYAVLPGRRGVASLLAMLFMVIFSALALGFYAATTTASQVASNERTSLAAQTAAESGIQFLRYHLSAMDIPPGLNNDQLFDEVHNQLSGRLDNTANLNYGRIGYDPNSITIPASGYVNLDPSGDSKFKITITRAGDQLISKIVGRNGSLSV